jgi:hypothetical protein
MGTRSRIGIIDKDGSVESIYCHWDGYPSWNGKLLLEHYTTVKKIRGLLALGDISNLAPSIEKPEGHTFDNKIEGYVTAYGRDRGENDVASVTHSSLGFFKTTYGNSDEEYFYLYSVKEKKWKFADMSLNFRELTLNNCKD